MRHLTSANGSQLLLRTGIQRSKKAPSALHPYGYMKDKFVWSLISAVGIFCLGAGVTVIHGFHNLFVQQQLEHLAAGLTGEPSLPPEDVLHMLHLRLKMPQCWDVAVCFGSMSPIIAARLVHLVRDQF